MKTLKPAVKYSLLVGVCLTLFLGGFNNCQNFKGNSSDMAVGFIGKPGEVCTQALSYLFDPNTKECLTAKDGCETRYYIEQGLIEVPITFCEYNEVPSESLQWIDLDQPMVARSNEELCTMNFEILLNKDLNVCTQAKNGCEISFAKSLGFGSDTEDVCSSALEN